jgi:hypothetical protein
VATLVDMPIPASHRDLLDRPLPAALTTHFGRGRMQSSVVWFWREGDDVCLTTMTEFVKARNLRERPRATVLVWDADGRWLELRCAAAEVAQTPAEALAACDDAGFRYCGVRPYFGAVVPAEWAAKEHPVTFRFTPEAVSCGVFTPDEPAATVGAAAGTGPDDQGVRSAATPRTHGSAAPDTPEPPVDDRAVPLPASHLALLAGGALPLLATRGSDGHARVQPVASSLVGHRPAVRPTSEQGDDLALDPRATLLAVDRADTVRWIEVRADAARGADGWWELVPRHVVVDAIHP